MHPQERHIDEIGILKYILDFPAGEQVLDVLGDARGYTTPFSEPLPDFDAVCCGLFLFQQEVELVYIVPGVLFAVAVDGDTVPDLILYDEHQLSLWWVKYRAQPEAIST